MLTRPAMLPGMEEDDGRSGEASQDRTVTANQVAAWNMAWYRKIAQMTQQELADATGWTKSAVSELERSWNGKRPREFDAQTLTVLAVALGIPVLGLLLPPEDEDGRLLIPAGPGRFLGMAGLAELVMPDADADTLIMEEYRKRLTRTVHRWLDSSWARDMARWLRRLESDEVMAARAERYRVREQLHLEHAAEARQFYTAIEAELSGTGEEP